MMNSHNKVGETTSLLASEQQPQASASSTYPANSSSSTLPQDQATEAHVEVDAAVVWTVVPIIIIGVFVAHIDSSLVVSASQRIASEFNEFNSASWVVTSYALAQCASQPLYGKLSTIFGRKANLAWCYFFFALGCLVCAVGQEYWQVLAGRIISGFGGAGMTALVSVIIADLVPVRKIAAWRSSVNLAATLGRSLGGPVGGWLTDTVGWRWSFLGQVPLTVFGLILLLWALPSTTRSTSTSQQKSSIRQKMERIDTLGAFSLSLTITCFLLTLDFATKPLPWYYKLITATFTFIAGCIFYLVERRYAREPILPLGLITKRVAWNAYLLAGFQIAGQGTMFYSTPIYYQLAAGFSVAGAGARLIPAVVGNATGGIVSGVIISRTGRYKLLTILASAVATAGYILISVRWTGSTSWWETQYIFLGGFGMGVIQSTMFVHLATDLDQDDLAIAGTNLYLAQSVFGVIGIQVSTTILHATLWPALNKELQGVPDKQKIIAAVTSNVGSIALLPDSIRTVVEHVYVHSLQHTYVSPVVFASLGFLLGLSIREGNIQ